MNNMLKFYNEQVVKQLVSEYGYKNPMEVPRIKAVFLNRGIGDMTDKKVLVEATDELTTIAGQKAVVTKARKSVAGFKIREGWPIGCKVTLRKKRMWDFIERLVAISLPRVRDFRGLSYKSFDGHGNFALGIQEQSIFPEIKYENIKTFRGLDIVIQTTAKTDKEALSLLRALSFPIRKPENIEKAVS